MCKDESDRQMTARWEDRLVDPETVLTHIKPGMSIFLGTGVAEPRALVRALTACRSGNVEDLELIQLVSLGDAVTLAQTHAGKFRLKTFFAGWVADEAITSGRVDLIPSRFSRIPALMESGAIRMDAAFVQITPPDADGYCTLGVAVDVARQAMEQASLVVGEINGQVPRTLGDTMVHVDDFDLLVESTAPPFFFPRWPASDVYDKIAANVAPLVRDGSCLAFSVGPLFEALTRHLEHKRHLGVHTAVFTDALMDLVKSGAVTNRRKGTFRGKSVTAYALGTRELMDWLHQNPLVEFQGIDVVGDPMVIGSNERFVAILSARKVDLTGSVALPVGKGNVGMGPGQAQEFLWGAALSRGGRAVLALPSRNLKGESKIVVSVEKYPNELPNREWLDLVVTEYGTASMSGRTIRERALALIDIAHPDDRETLVRLAKEKQILFPHQVYPAESGRHYPEKLSRSHTFRDGLTVHFRAIRPSDVDEMRGLFYRFSDRSVYYRYFSPVRAMPHAKMQKYVNVHYTQTLSMVGLVGEPGAQRIIAEARYHRYPESPYPEVAFVVDDAYQGKGIATYLFRMLMEIAGEQGITAFTASVLASNTGMLRVFEKAPFPLKAVFDHGVYELTIPLTKEAAAELA